MVYCFQSYILVNGSELEKHDKEAGGWREEAEMADEAESVRRAWKKT